MLSPRESERAHELPHMASGDRHTPLARRMLLQLSANTLVQLLLLVTALRRLSSLPKRIGRPLVESMASDIHYDLLVRAARRALVFAALHSVRAGCSRSRVGCAGDWRRLGRFGMLEAGGKAG